MESQPLTYTGRKIDFGRIEGELASRLVYRKRNSYSQQKLLPMRQSVSHRTQVSINQLTVILRDTVPPIIEVAKLAMQLLLSIAFYINQPIKTKDMIQENASDVKT